jgi:Universal stress protein family
MTAVKICILRGGIVDYAEDKGIDLIVIGTRGKSGFKKMLLGSVASKVVTYAHCPVLVVKKLVKINIKLSNIILYIDNLYLFMEST